MLASADEEEFVRIIAHAFAHVAGWHQWHVPNQGPVPVIYMGGRFGLGADDEMAPLGYKKTMQDYEVAANKLTDQMMAGLSAEPSTSQYEFLKMQAEVRKLVAQPTPRPPSLRNSQ